MPRSWLDGKVAVAGIGHTAYGRRGEFAERGTFALACEAVVRACEDAGVYAGAALAEMAEEALVVREPSSRRQGSAGG